MIRQANDRDREALGRVYCSSWREGYRGIIPDAYLDKLTVDICAPKKVNPDNNLVADIGGIIGLVNFGASREAENAGELRAIYVMPEYWGSGCAQELFSAAAEELRRQEYESFYLWVLEENVRARKFYEKMGMKPSGDKKIVSIGGKDLYEIRYDS